MKKNMTLKIKTILSFAAASLLLALASCSNLGGGYVANGAPDSNAVSGGQNGAGQGGSQETVMVTVSGSIDFDGALPEQIAALVENSIDAGLDQGGELGLDGIARSAFPEVASLSGVTYEVYAEEVTTNATKLRFEGTVAADGKSYTIGVPVLYDKQYNVTATAKQGGIAMLAGTSSVVLKAQSGTLSTFITNANIKLTAVRTDTGVGRVSLAVSDLSAEILSAKALYIDPSDSSTKTIEGTKSGTTWTFAQGTLGTDGEGNPVINNGLKSGYYPMTFEFYSAASYGGNLKYSFKEGVNVFDGLATNKWVQNGAEPWFYTTTTDGVKTTVCQITPAIIQGYGLTDIYVDSSAANDSGSGTFFSPKKHFAAAMGMLLDETKNYKIHIKGTFKETANLNFGHIIPSTASAKSLVLRGLSDPVGGVPQDVLSGNGSRGVLFVEAAFPVTIENLKITDGKAQYGGGIGASGGDLILGNGAYISGNEATYDGSGGGGVYFNGTELIMLDGAVIENNTTSANVCGGGVYLCSGKKFTMNGGVIKGNMADGSGGFGGGVYVVSGTFTMTGGVIGDDSMNTPASSTALRSNLASLGGGVYLCSSGTTVDTYFNFTGGTIAYNFGAFGGGGIYAKYCDATIRGAIKCNGTEAAAAGYGGGGIQADQKSTIRLENCTIEKNKSNGSRKGGAIYVKSQNTAEDRAVISLKGSVSIPCTGINQNDILLTTTKTNPTAYCLTIAGKLTATGAVAKITPASDNNLAQGYDETIQVIKLASGVTDTTLANVCGLFEVTAQGQPVPQTWAVGADGKMVKSNVLTGSTIGSFTYDSIVSNQEYHFVIGSDVNDNQFSSFMGKLCHSSANKISENSTLDLSKATSLDGLTWPSISTGAWLQKFDTVIIGPNFNTNWYNSLNIHYVFLKVKNIVAPSNCANFSSDNGILFNKDKTKIVFYPGGSVREEDSYTIPSSVTEIAPYTFYWATGDDTGLMAITIRANVKKIGKYAFPTLARFTSSGTLTFNDPNGWHIGTTSGTAIASANLTAAYYKANLETSTLVKE